MVRFRLLGPIKVVAKSMNCNYNCEFPKVSVVILNFFHINLDLLLVCFTIWVPDLVVLVYPFLLGMYPLYCNFCGVVSAR